IVGEPSAVIGGSRRKAGVNARNVRVNFTGAAPAGYETDGVITLPVFLLATFTGIRKGQTGTYLGSAIRVVGKTAEKIN
ncbi:hypothetical protein LVR55_29035, partial [Pseudomonas aeruginosa]|uniref:hypothetical protein n=1 Tax=Pseudomonas aeruginosa TaxID=287 RepID=UPI0020941DD9